MHTRGLDSAVARNTVCRSASFIPWVRRMRSAYKARADDEIISEMCCSMENCPVSVTPNNFTLITRRMSGSSGISWICRVLGHEMIISWDFLQFNWRLFSVDHDWILLSSVCLVSKFLAGMIKVKSSANLTNLFPSTTGCKSEAATS